MSCIPCPSRKGGGEIPLSSNPLKSRVLVVSNRNSIDNTENILNVEKDSSTKNYVSNNYKSQIGRWAVMRRLRYTMF